MKGLKNLRTKVRQNSSSIILQKTQSAVKVKKVAKLLIEFWDIYMLNHISIQSDKLIDDLLDKALEDDPNRNITSIESLMAESKTSRNTEVKVSFVNAIFGSNSTGYLTESSVGYSISLQVNQIESLLWLRCNNSDILENPTCDESITFSEECIEAFNAFNSEFFSFMKDYGVFEGGKRMFKWTGSPIETLFMNHIKTTCESMSYMNWTINKQMTTCIDLSVDIRDMILTNNEES